MGGVAPITTQSRNHWPGMTPARGTPASPASASSSVHKADIPGSTGGYYEPRPQVVDSIKI